MLALLFLCAALVRGDCPACDGCETIPSAHIEDLCADSLCINGHPVPPGDGNPCTIEDIVGGVVTSVHIKDCCSEASDCVQFRPSACYVSTCELEDLGEGSFSTHGWCKHEPIVNCCEDASDCVKEKCKTYQCSGNCVNGLVFTQPEGSPHKTAWVKRNVEETLSCSQCIATDIPNCCLTSADCNVGGSVGTCDTNEIGICDGNNQCICISTPSVECTHANEATDCAYLEAKLAECPNQCAAIHCNKGYCVIEADATQDADGDDVPCTTDCDDHDASVSDYIWCANPTGQNDDGDAFLKCGTAATRYCASECPLIEGGTTRMTQVSFDDLTSCSTPSGPCTLSYSCDCCDASASQERPDHAICCEADCEAELPQGADQVLECGGDSQTVCWTPPAVYVGVTDKQKADEECYAWGSTTPKPAICDCEPQTTLLPDGTPVDRCENCWRSSADAPCNDKCSVTLGGAKKRAAGVCDQCPDDPTATTADKTCFLDCDNDGHPACPLDSGSARECCQSFADRQFVEGGYEHVDADVKACCALILASATFPDDGDATDWFAGTCTHSSTPYIPKQCSCKESYIAEPTGGFVEEEVHLDYCDCTDAEEARDYIVTCGQDADGDGIKACANVRTCTSVFPGTAGQFTTESCVAIGLVAPREDGQPCDCDDLDEAVVYSSHGCFADVDLDTFPNCNSCVETCDECPAGSVKIQATQPTGDRAPRVRSPFGKRVAPTYLSCPAEGDTIVNAICDCCDSDMYAFPGSTWCSSSARRCTDDVGAPSFDYNCDGVDDRKVVCEDNSLCGVDAGDSIVHETIPSERFIRPCQDPDDWQIQIPRVYNNSATDGQCIFNVNNNTCSTVPGFCVNRKRSIGMPLSVCNKKRQTGDGGVNVPAPIECNGQTVTDCSPGEILSYGECFEYLEACHGRPIAPPITTCHDDCEVCVLVGQ